MACIPIDWTGFSLDVKLFPGLDAAPSCSGPCMLRSDSVEVFAFVANRVVACSVLAVAVRRTWRGFDRRDRCNCDASTLSVHSLISAVSA